MFLPVRLRGELSGSGWAARPVVETRLHPEPADGSAGDVRWFPHFRPKS